MFYSDGLRARMVKRLSGPCPTSATALAKECGIPQQTLSRWLREASTVPPMSNEPDKPAARPDRTAEEKLRMVLEASRLSEAELGAYLRREGLHSTQLEEWRHAMLESLSDANSPAKRNSADRRRAKKEAERIRALERDLDRKNKALAPRGTPKTSQSGTPENQPVVKGIVGVDAAWAVRLPRGDGERLENREARTGACAGAPWLVAAADPA